MFDTEMLYKAVTNWNIRCIHNGKSKFQVPIPFQSLSFDIRPGLLDSSLGGCMSDSLLSTTNVLPNVIGSTSVCIVKPQIDQALSDTKQHTMHVVNRSLLDYIKVT